MFFHTVIMFHLQYIFILGEEEHIVMGYHELMHDILLLCLQIIFYLVSGPCGAIPGDSVSE